MATLFALGALHAYVVADTLPERVASHFGPDGRADGFESRGQFFLMFAALSALAMLVLLSIPWLVRRLPRELVNLPNKSYWLTPEREGEALAKLADFSATFAVITSLLLFVVFELVLYANQHGGGLPNEIMLPLLGAYMAAVIAALVRMARAFAVR